MMVVAILDAVKVREGGQDLRFGGSDPEGRKGKEKKGARTGGQGRLH